MVKIKKKTHIYYRYGNDDIQFAFEEDFEGHIDGDVAGLRCTTFLDTKDFPTARITYITELLTNRELLRIVTT